MRSASLLLLGLLTWSVCLAQSPVDFVNPMVGTDFNGHTFPGATLPFGMVQLSPDTRIDGSWEGCSGYHYSDSVIYGFSHTHLSGTGVSDYGDILLMPQIGKASFDPPKYASRFSHDNEMSSAGYYSVRFDNGIEAALTVSTRAGFHRYRFPTADCSVLLDLQHRDKLIDHGIEVVSKNQIRVKRVSEAWAREQHCYAYIECSSPFVAVYNADSTKLMLNFQLSGRELLIKVGLSFVSESGAEKNLRGEIPHWDFGQVQENARNIWNKALSKIEVEDASANKLRTFYTALYHTMIHPNIATDTDGKYRGMDQKIHKAVDFNYYTVFSLWDTFRATHPLYTIIEPERTIDFIKTFLAMYEQGGRLPVWELSGNETDCMIGYHSVSVIADALCKGIDDFDIELAFEAMLTSASWDHLGLPQYRTQGFLSIDDEHESVSKTLEYAYDDWCIAQVAHRLGKTETYDRFMERSNAWRNLLDPATKLMRPRQNGGWLTPFDPREVNFHFTEGNAWQYSFFVPQNIPGMIEAMGGSEAFEQKLDQLFSAPIATTGRSQVDITGLMGQYAHGNEPSHHMAFLYNYIGKPQKTEALVHRILEEFYTDQPDGLIGNEDCGQMSAWYVMASLGIYAVTPGTPNYTLVEPFVDNYKVLLSNGKSFSKADITTRLELSPFINHSALTGTKTPNPNEPNAQPEYIASPVFFAPSISFDDSMEISICVPEGTTLEYQIENEDGSWSERMTKTPFTIREDASIIAYTVVKTDTGTRVSRATKAHYHKTPHPNWSVELHATYNTQYTAGGPAGIIDGVRGSVNWRRGQWQGYQGQDFEVVINLSEVQPINRIAASFLQDTRSWIILPTNVQFFLSTDGNAYEFAGRIESRTEPENFDLSIENFTQLLDKPAFAQYVKVVAKNYGLLPDWHPGYGGEAFIFVDEVIIE